MPKSIEGKMKILADHFLQCYEKREIVNIILVQEIIEDIYSQGREEGIKTSNSGRKMYEIGKEDGSADTVKEKRQKMLELYDTILETDSEEVKIQKYYLNTGIAYCLGVLNSTPTEEHGIELPNQHKKNEQRTSRKTS